MLENFDAMANRSHLQNIKRRTLLFAVTMLALAAVSTSRSAIAQSPAQTVRLVVDYGDGTTKTINDLAWSKGNTVLDAMKAATARPHGISFSYTGAGDTAMVTKIDDVQNQGGGAGKKNWQYGVNGTPGNRSFAAFELQAQDVVVWRFATEQAK